MAQQTLLTDDFTVTSNSQDPNQELGLRQTGPLSPFTYTRTPGSTQTQVGNTVTDVGQPGGAPNGDYLLLAFNSGVYSDLEINAALADGGPLTIAFDMYVSGNPLEAPADQWGAVVLRPPGDNFPVADAGEFGMLMRNDGRIQMFQAADPTPAAWDVAGYSTDSRWELTFSDTAGTGSAFVGNGSLLTFTNGANVETVALNQLNSTGLRLGFRNFDGMFAGIDNIEIIGNPTTVPGDADGNGIVDINDFFVISDNFYTEPAIVGDDGDITQDGFVDELDFRLWRIAFGSDSTSAVQGSGVVPEPTAVAMLGIAVALSGVTRRR